MSTFFQSIMGLHDLRLFNEIVTGFFFGIFFFLTALWTLQLRKAFEVAAHE